MTQMTQVMRPYVFGLLIFLAACDLPDAGDYAAPLLLAGEATDSTLMLHARLNAADTLDASGDLSGTPGWARFEYSLDPAMGKLVRHTPWRQARAEEDYIIRETLTGLYPGRPYYYRLRYGPDTLRTLPTGAHEIRTLDPDQPRPIRLVMVTGSHYDRFHLGGSFGLGRDTSQGKSGYDGPDAHLGFPAYEAIRLARPDYFIGNGDNVYYDHPEFEQATDSAGMRRKWHRLFSQPRLRGLLRGVGTYWLKDDHDYRYDDADTTGERKPGHTLGMALFPEQVPFPAVPYRTLRMSPDLQL
ncbi:MAG: alkaline phosphatase, partial [Bacteroidetes bacterium]